MSLPIALHRAASAEFIEAKTFPTPQLAATALISRIVIAPTVHEKRRPV